MKKRKAEYPYEVWSGQSLVTIYRSQKAGVYRYMLRWQEAGKMERKTYSDPSKAKIEALTIANRLAAGEVGAITLNGDESAVYRRAMEAINVGENRPALDAVCKEWAEAKRRLGSTLLLHAVDDYIKRHSGKNLPLSKAVDDFLASRVGVTAVYLQRLSDRLQHLKEAFGTQLLSAISEQEIRSFVDKQGGSPRTRKNMRDAIVSVWRWARREGYLPRDMQTEAERVEAPIIKRSERIGIFTVEEMRNLLTEAPEHVRPVIAICGFAGVRSQGEISRLQWEDVKWDRNVIDVAGKTGERRYAPIQPNLAAWLEPFRSAKGPVAKSQSDGAFSRVAAKAGVPWKHNGLRHSFGSYRVAITKSVDQTSLEMGNSPVMVRRHYLEAVHENEAKEWFSIMP